MWTAYAGAITCNGPGAADAWPASMPEAEKTSAHKRGSTHYFVQDGETL